MDHAPQRRAGYDAVTGALTPGGFADCGTGPQAICHNIGGDFANGSPDTTSTKTRLSAIVTGVCRVGGGGGGVLGKYTTATQTIDLSDEDTEDDAIARAGGIGGWVKGSGFSGCESGPATRSTRAAGVFTGQVVEKRVRAAWSADPTRSYTLTYTFGRRPNGSNAAYSAISQIVAVVTADEANETDPTWRDVPNEAGYETECIGMDITIVPIP